MRLSENGIYPPKKNDMWETADNPLELGDPRFRQTHMGGMLPFDAF